MDFFSIDNLQRLKLAVHITQAIFIFLSWCIMIGVFHNAFLIDGGPAWFFTLVRCAIHTRETTKLTDSPVLSERSSYNIPNIDTHVRTVPEMEQSLRLRRPRRNTRNLLALSIRVLSRIQ